MRRTVQPDPDRSGADPKILCQPDALSVRIDEFEGRWPQKDGLVVGRLEVGSKHRITILWGDKPEQSFTFRFSTFKADRLCLFINDMYRTPQLWQFRRSPCRCK